MTDEKKKSKPYANQKIKQPCFNSDLLLKLRYASGLSISALAIEIGVEKNTLWTLENNTRQYPSFIVIGKIAEYFRRPMDDFKVGSFL